MMSDSGAGSDAGNDRKGRADRLHHREYVVLRALAALNDEPPTSCGLMDISVGGAKLKMDFGSPEVGDRIMLIVEILGFRAAGNVIRTFYTPTGLEVAVRFEQEHAEIPAKLLQYKLRSHEHFKRGRR